VFKVFIILDMSNISQIHNNEMSITPSLELFINLSRTLTTVTRKFDHMGSMVGFTDFIILYQLNTAEDKKLRRIDLADKIGLTASGVTRLLLPMEKIGLVGRDTNPRDARVSYVTLAPGGERVLREATERAEMVASSIVPSKDIEKIDMFIRLSNDIRRLAHS
jgi:DNA-binding MarR family transcriptional regulator